MKAEANIVFDPVYTCSWADDEYRLEINQWLLQRFGLKPTMLDYLRAWKWLPSREGKHVYASDSEKRRWFERGSVEVNGEKTMASDPWPFVGSTVVLHPKGKHRTTLA